MRQEVSADLCIDWWVEGDVALARVTGEVDESNAAVLAGVLESCFLEGVARVEVDLGGVTFLGAAGVRPLLCAAGILGPDWVSIRRIKRFHREVIRLCDPEGRISLPG